MNIKKNIETKPNIVNNNLTCVMNNVELIDEIDNLIPKDFNYNEYILINQDLKNCNEIQAKKHYLTHGKNEKRFTSINEINNLIPKDFNYNEYILINKNLNINEEIQAKKHYLIYGKNEKRFYSFKHLNNKKHNKPDFRQDAKEDAKEDVKEDVKQYVKEDVKQDAKEYDKQHVKQNDNSMIDYHNFDWKSYLFLNESLKDNKLLTDHSSCYHHYVNYGFNKNNNYYKINYDNFDWELYLYNNDDLSEIGINSKEKVWEHWNSIGFKQTSNNKKNIFFNNRFILNTYLDLLDEFMKLYNVTKHQVLSNPKIEFRYFCFKYLDYIRNFKIDDIITNSNFEAVLVEFRSLPHLEFIIRNNILKLGKTWSFSIVCGNLNYDFIKNISNNISENIKVIKINYDNLFQSEYSKLLASEYFWNLFHGEKILIYQEDSLIFKSNIDDFLECDYIGAPWPEYQNDNKYKVGNGGLSLRSKKCMIDVINKIDITKTEINSSTLNYMKSTGQKIIPEDVYFTINMLKYGIGKVANKKTASNFSTELIYNENSFGGHNFWLANNSCWKHYLYKHILYCNPKLFNICAISTPYGFRMGGGEIYLLNIAKYFINYKNCIIYLFTHENHEISKKTIKEILSSNYINYFVFFEYKQISHFTGKVTFHIDMSNSKYPVIKGCANNTKHNFFHCQFPFDTNKDSCFTNLCFYENIILNSDFTKEKYIQFTSENTMNKKIHVINPSCFNDLELKHYKKDGHKDKNSFVLIGRIFDFNNYANNKNFDIVLNYFEELNVNSITKFSVHIIGEVYSEKMLTKLKSYKINNIQFHTNISNDEKYKIISQCQYVINMVGINRDIDEECYAYEHFGISMIEAIYFKCIPISINGGYPPYYIKEGNGYLFDNEEQFYNILKEIIIENKIISYNEEYYNPILENFNHIAFNKKMELLLN